VNRIALSRRCSRALGPVVAVQESAKRFPHIKTGEEFTGYQKPG
jgi:hypothetical protein